MKCWFKSLGDFFQAEPWPSALPPPPPPEAVPKGGSPSFLLPVDPRDDAFRQGGHAGARFCQPGDGVGSTLSGGRDGGTSLPCQTLPTPHPEACTCSEVGYNWASRPEPCNPCPAHRRARGFFRSPLVGRQKPDPHGRGTPPPGGWPSGRRPGGRGEGSVRPTTSGGGGNRSAKSVGRRQEVRKPVGSPLGRCRCTTGGPRRRGQAGSGRGEGGVVLTIFGCQPPPSQPPPPTPPLPPPPRPRSPPRSPAAPPPTGPLSLGVGPRPLPRLGGETRCGVTRGKEKGDRGPHSGTLRGTLEVSAGTTAAFRAKTRVVLPTPTGWKATGVP